MSSKFVYSASEARKLWRVLLDRAVAGETIYIERGGVEFILKATDKSPFVPDFKQEYIIGVDMADPKGDKQVYTAPPAKSNIERGIEVIKDLEKNNSEGKPSKRNICPQHLVDKDTCKLMKHKA